MRIMVTGFGRFLDNEKNPTKEVLRILPKSIYGNEIKCVELPVIFDECFDYLKPIIVDFQPDVIIMLGLAGGRTAITPERIAINMNSASIADNDGETLIDSPIRKDGKCAYFATIPLRSMIDEMNKIVPTRLSNTAGTYVCNNIMFKVLEYVKDPVLAGFIHVPMMTGMNNPKDFFELDIKDMTNAIVKGIEVIIDN